jgi:hypothetical protein
MKTDKLITCMMTLWVMLVISMILFSLYAYL